MNNEIYLKDIAGYEEEKAEARKIIEVLKNHDKYEKIGAYIPKGLILSGNPGVGKTMLAKAIASESNVPFYEFESNETESAAETIKSIRDLFKKAKENAPSILFIDEFDELVMTEDFSSDYARKVTKILLTEIDGITNTDGVLVIATTNFRGMLPRSILRSGRMDKRITLDLPTASDREEIFKLYLGKNELLNKIDAYELSQKTSGFTGADIKTLVNETIIDCASQGKETITMGDFERNIPIVFFQDIKKKNKKGPEDVTCYHEIGHFICEYKTSEKIGSISTEKYGQVEGHVHFEEEPTDVRQLTRNSLKPQLVTILGGIAGEEVMCQDASCGCSEDLAKAKRYIGFLMRAGVFGFDKVAPKDATEGFGTRQVLISQKKLERIEELESSLLTEAFEEAKSIIEQNKNLVEYIYKELKAKERLSKKEVEKILKDYKEREGN